MGLGLSGGNGLRVKKVSGSTATVYIFSGSKVIAEYDNGAAVGSPSREYVYGGSALLAKIDSTGMKYYHQDQLSNRLVTSSTGAVLEQMGHYPFGDPWYNASNDKLLFTSYERDSESSNDYAQARFFRWLIGSFLSPDPLPGSTSDPQSLNRYTYVENNPIGFVDPSGAMEEESCDDSVDDSCGGGGGGGDGFCLGCDVGWMPASGDLGAPLPAGKTGLLGTLLNILGSIFSGAGQGGVGDGGQDLWMTSATLGGYTSPDPFNATSAGFGLGPIVGGGGSGSGPQKSRTPQNNGPNLSQKGQVCQEKVQSAVNAALNTSSQFQGPELDNNLDASQPGLINGAYNFNYFAPGVNLNSLTNCGRFPSGLHIVMQTPGCNGLNDPNIFNVTPSGSYFTAHIDSASPVDLITALIHFGRDIVAPRLFHYNHGC